MRQAGTGGHSSTCESNARFAASSPVDCSGGDASSTGGNGGSQSAVGGAGGEASACETDTSTGWKLVLQLAEPLRWRRQTTSRHQAVQQPAVVPLAAQVLQVEPLEVAGNAKRRNSSPGGNAR